MYAKLVKAINKYIDAEKKYDTAFEAYDGYSWDWVGGPVREDMEKAERAMKDAFDAAVDLRVKEVLTKAGINVQIQKDFP